MLSGFWTFVNLIIYQLWLTICKNGCQLSLPLLHTRAIFLTMRWSLFSNPFNLGWPHDFLKSMEQGWSHVVWIPGHMNLATSIFPYQRSVAINKLRIDNEWDHVEREHAEGNQHRGWHHRGNGFALLTSLKPGPELFLAYWRHMINICCIKWLNE